MLETAQALDLDCFGKRTCSDCCAHARQVGTPTYMSPEVVMGNNRYDAKVGPRKVLIVLAKHLQMTLRNVACVH